MKIWVIVRNDGSLVPRGYANIVRAWEHCSALNLMCGKKYTISSIG